MKEVKSPKKPLIYYYGVVLLVLLVFNLVITPLLLKQEVTEVDYGTFMSMTESKNIGQVQVEDQQIVFTDKDEKNVYQTNVMDDPNLTERLYESGAKFSKDVDASTSPLLSLLITGLLPMLIFIGLGQYMAKKLREQMGGKYSPQTTKPNSMINILFYKLCSAYMLHKGRHSEQSHQTDI